MKRSYKKAFTLIELLIVAAIIGAIQLIVVYTYINTQKQSRDVKRKADIAKLATAIEMYHSDKKEYPATSLWVSSQYNSQSDTLANTLLKGKYIDSIPCDPKVSSWNCSQGGHNQGSNPDFGYIYILKNYNFSGSYNGAFPGKNKYGLYSTLEVPTTEDKESIKHVTGYEKSFIEYMKSKYKLEILYKNEN